MNKNSLKIIATIIAKTNDRKEVLSSIKKVEKESQKEDGNISYLAYQDTQSNDKFVIVEDWKSQEAIDIHNQTKHFNTFKAEIDGKVESLSIDIIKEIED